MIEVVFTDHARWRAAERHGGSVCIDHLEAEISAAIAGGWYRQEVDSTITVNIRGGERFVVLGEDGVYVVLTSLGKAAA
jgi:hypothetical protein